MVEKLETISLEKDKLAVNILIVDDEEIIRHLLSDILANEGYKVCSRPCAESALELIREGKTDIVITDIRMSGMDGIELLRQTKQVSPNTEVIVMTGYASSPCATEEVISLGAVNLLKKPLDINRLKTAVIEAYNRHI